MTLALAVFFAPGKWHSIFAEWPPKKMPLKLKIRHWLSAPHSTVLASNLESSRCYWSQEFQRLQGGYKLEEKQRQRLDKILLYGMRPSSKLVGFFIRFACCTDPSSPLASSLESTNGWVDWWFGARYFGFLGFPLWKVLPCYLSLFARIWNHQTNPQTTKFTIGWLESNPKKTKFFGFDLHPSITPPTCVAQVETTTSSDLETGGDKICGGIWGHENVCFYRFPYK